MNNTLKKKLENLPQYPGVYIMRDISSKIIYIGKATSLKTRVKSYFSNTEQSLKNVLLVKLVKSIDYILTDNVKSALVLEESLIKRFQPKYNVMWKDDKRYPYLKITNEQFPAVIIVRQKKTDGCKYFGPYPDVTDMKKTLRIIYKNFGVRPCRYNLDKRKIGCLYYHLAKCPAPCIGKIDIKSYYHIVANVIMFLSGKNNQLIKSLENEMAVAEKKLEFENAAKLRDTIFAVRNTLEKITAPLLREVTLEDILLGVDRTSYISDLCKLIGKNINRIEGFDISNISGGVESGIKYAVGSMVVFECGLPLKSDYRRFKIRTIRKTNDCAMIREIIKRRYSGSLSLKMPLPDLIIIDGGKGQLSAAERALKATLPKLPEIIAIAKQKEELFFTDNEESVILAKNSLALNLIKYIRDEAHRFAISYHKLLRRKLLKE
ncbi:MAG: excinuclease ABC subunit UvrC [Elusimicrobiota bacterium]